MPPSPPLAPGETLKHTITWSQTQAGNVDDVNTAEQQGVVANELGVDEDDVSVQVSAASVKVDFSVTVPDGTSADALVALVERTFANATAASQLLNVTVLSASDVQVATTVVAATESPTPQITTDGLALDASQEVNTDQGDGEAARNAAVGGALTGAVVLVWFVAFTYGMHKRRQKRNMLARSTGSSKEVPIVTVEPDAPPGHKVLKAPASPSPRSPSKMSAEEAAAARMETVIAAASAATTTFEAEAVPSQQSWLSSQMLEETGTADSEAAMDAGKATVDAGVAVGEAVMHAGSKAGSMAMDASAAAGKATMDAGTAVCAAATDAGSMATDASKATAGASAAAGGAVLEAGRAAAEATGAAIKEAEKRLKAGISGMLSQEGILEGVGDVLKGMPDEKDDMAAATAANEREAPVDAQAAEEAPSAFAADMEAAWAAKDRDAQAAKEAADAAAKDAAAAQAAAAAKIKAADAKLRAAMPLPLIRKTSSDKLRPAIDEAKAEGASEALVAQAEKKLQETLDLEQKEKAAAEAKAKAEEEKEAKVRAEAEEKAAAAEAKAAAAEAAAKEKAAQAQKDAEDKAAKEAEKAQAAQEKAAAAAAKAEQDAAAKAAEKAEEEKALAAAKQEEAAKQAAEEKEVAERAKAQEEADAKEAKASEAKAEAAGAPGSKARVDEGAAVCAAATDAGSTAGSVVMEVAVAVGTAASDASKATADVSVAAGGAVLDAGKAAAGATGEAVKEAEKRLKAGMSGMFAKEGILDEVGHVLKGMPDEKDDGVEPVRSSC